MIVNILKSYLWAAVYEMGMKAIFAMMNTTWAVMEIRPEKIQACAEFEPVFMFIS